MSFASITLVVMRESLEALLILGILIGLVTKLGHRQARRPLYNGALAGLAVSLALGIAIIRGIRGMSEHNQEIFEGLASLAAVAILTYMIVWMVKHTRTMMGTLQNKTRLALETGKSGILFTLTFVAVLREGFETVVFIGADATGSIPIILAATLTGIAASAILAYLLFAGVIRLSIEKFFAVTGAILVIFAGGLLMYGLHELMEVGWLPATAVLWDLSNTLPHKEGLGSILNAIVGYRANPRLLEAAAWLLYVGGMGAWYLKPFLARRRRNSPSPEPLKAAVQDKL